MATAGVPTEAELDAMLDKFLGDIDEVYIFRILKQRIEQKVANKSEHFRAYVAAQLDLFQEQLEQAGLI